MGKARAVGALVVLLASCGGRSRDTAETNGDEPETGGFTASGGTSSTPSAGTSSSSGGAAPQGGVAPAGGSASGGAVSTGGEAASSGGAVRVIDDVDHAGSGGYPPLPPEAGSAFWWGPGWLGNWFLASPPPNASLRDAPMVEIDPPRGTSTKAYRAKGSGHERGVDLWVQLDHLFDHPKDLSAYAGIGFWARLEGGNGQIIVGMNPGYSYFEAPEKVPSLSVDVGETWEQLSLPFEAFGIDGSILASFDFIVGSGGVEFDLWIDDVFLVCRGECPKL